MFYCCGITDKGIMPHNEDALLINKTVIVDGNAEFNLESPFIAAVSDGVSGELSGEIASRLCLELLSEIKYTKTIDLSEPLLQIHNKLCQYSKKHKKAANMQTTLCAIAIDEENNAVIANSGDSRLYIYKRSSLKQISKDQSLVQMLYEEGAITASQKKNHMHRNIIFPVIGNNSSFPEFDIKPLCSSIEHGDLFLICTDGLTDYVDNSEIEEILSLPLKLPKRLSKLIEAALSKGGKDNITIIGMCCM